MSNAVKLNIDWQLKLAVFAAMIRCGADTKFVDEYVIISNISDTIRKEWLNENKDKDWEKSIKWILSELSRNRFDGTNLVAKPEVINNDGTKSKGTWYPGILEKKRGSRLFKISDDADDYMAELIDKFGMHVDSIHINGNNTEVYHDLSAVDESKLILIDEDFIEVFKYLKEKGKLPQSVENKIYVSYNF